MQIEQEDIQFWGEKSLNTSVDIQMLSEITCFPLTCKVFASEWRAIYCETALSDEKVKKKNVPVHLRSLEAIFRWNCIGRPVSYFLFLSWSFSVIFQPVGWCSSRVEWISHCPVSVSVLQFLPLNPELLETWKCNAKLYFFFFNVLLVFLQGDLDHFQRLTVDASKCLLEV